MSDTTPQPVTGTAEELLVQKYGDAVKPDDRSGYDGLVVDADSLVDVAKTVRDELGYNLLSSVNYVDYLADGFFEVVYNAYRVPQGGPALTFKARTPRDNAVLPSLTGIWPSADFQEREAWDLMGIRFAGHPNLKRILMWEGFQGHPMRKDWKEPFFEEEAKPYKSRWPEGHVRRNEMDVPYGMNVKYPEGFDPQNYQAEGDAALYAGLAIPETNSGIGVQQIKTDQLIVNLGPQHPSTHGVFRMTVTLDGETITKLEPVMGYLHRNHEQIGERNTYLMNMPYTDRLDYISGMCNNMAYALTIEKMLGQEVPYRAEVLRVLMVELTRIMNHYWAIGFLLNDLGAFFTPSLYAILERELILDLIEATAGSRMMPNYSVGAEGLPCNPTACLAPTRLRKLSV